MTKAGILGGGQLGRMLLQQAANYPVLTFVLENDPGCPAAHLCDHFVQGDIRDYETVLNFGRQADVLTIEIENVNIDALDTLEKEGKKIVPSPAVLRMIKNKITQKEFYKANGIPSPEFITTGNLAELRNKTAFLPAVHKLAEGGYDGKGVQVINNDADVEKGFDAPAVLEKKVDIAKEIAILVAINEKNDTVIYPPVEMIFDPYLNLLDYQLCPAQIDEKIFWKIEAIAIKLVKSFNSAGLFAVEMLIDQQGEVWVNETAPRVHNSGHHTIEAHFTSQYDMLWRILLNYPLGNPDMKMPSALINLIGAEGHSGPVHYDGLPTLLDMQNTYLHAYGKTLTKPGRKMGHVTVLGKDRIDLIRKAKQVKETVHVISK